MNSFTQDLITWIEKNLEMKLLIEDISTRAGYSKWHLQRIFWAETGVTLASYIRFRKLYRAAIMLKMTNLPVIDIAERLSFSTQQAFTRTFKRRFGLAPGQYRESSLWYFKGLIPELTEEHSTLPEPQLVILSLNLCRCINMSYTCNSTELNCVLYHTQQRQKIFSQAEKILGGVSPVSFAMICEPTDSHTDQIRFSLKITKNLSASDAKGNKPSEFLRFPFKGSSEELIEMQVNIYRHIMPDRHEARRIEHDFFICDRKQKNILGKSILNGFYYIPVSDHEHVQFV